MRPASTVSVADIDDGLALLDEQTGTFHHLNVTGAVVYRALERGGEDVAVAALAAQFHVDDMTARHDVKALVAHLHNQGLLTA